MSWTGGWPLHCDSAAGYLRNWSATGGGWRRLRERSPTGRARRDGGGSRGHDRHDGGVPAFEPFIRYHTFADSSINFTVILRGKEFVDQYLIKHEFVKRLHRRFNDEGIVIPFPIRTIARRAEPGRDARYCRTDRRCSVTRDHAASAARWSPGAGFGQHAAAHRRGATGARADRHRAESPVGSHIVSGPSRTVRMVAVTHAAHRYDWTGEAGARSHGRGGHAS